MRCLKNCGECCAVVPFSKGDIKSLKKLRKFAISKFKIRNMLVSDRRFKDGTPACPFLRSDRLCNIYKQRPRACRILLGTKKYPCPKLK